MQKSRSLDEKLSEEEREAFYDLSSERALAIILGSIVENHLTTVLRLLMRRERKLADELFNASGPLGSFGTKIRLAYMLRIIDEALYRDLITVSRIRNKLAHDLSIKTFENQQISAWVKNMSMYTMLVAMEKTAQENAGVDQLHLIKATVLHNALLSVVDSYRECLRFVIHHFIDFESTIKEKEAELNDRGRGAKPAPEEAVN